MTSLPQGELFAELQQAGKRFDPDRQLFELLAVKLQGALLGFEVAQKISENLAQDLFNAQ